MVSDSRLTWGGVVLKRFVVVGLVFSLAVSGWSVIATTSTTLPNPADTTWQWVGQMNGASAVAIGPRTVLTAAHVGAGSFVLGSNTYTALNSFVNPDSPDLLLVNLNQTLPGFYNVATSAPLNSTITMVGFGGSGVVNATNTGYNQTIGAGTRRAGQNTLDDFQFVGTIGNSHLSYIASAGDAVLVSGDSGGGWFNSSGQLIGINSFIFNLTSGYTGAPPPLPDFGFASANPGWSFPAGGVNIPAGTAYFGSGAIDVTASNIRTWITTNAVPEPTSMLAIGLGLAALARRRKAR